MRTFNIDGRERAFLFGLSSLTSVVEAVYTTEEQTEKQLILTILKVAPAAAVDAFKSGARAKKEEIDFTDDDVLSWVDQYPEILQEIIAQATSFIGAMSGRNQKKNQGSKKS
jgi:hypothetical protein